MTLISSICSDEIGLVARGLPVKPGGGRHMHCCCDEPPAQKNLKELAEKVITARIQYDTMRKAITIFS